jgi:L-iditol 2-dehydrogenase
VLLVHEFDECENNMDDLTLRTEPQWMRAARLYGFRDLRVEDIPMPSPGPGEVLLKVASVGVCGSDVHYYLEGGIGDQVISSPMVPGHEFSAWVTDQGEPVGGLAPGQLVAVDPAIPCGHCEFCETGHPNLCPAVRFRGSPGIDGACAEYIAMPVENCFSLPEGLDPDEGVLLETLGIAIHSVDLGHMKPGETVAVLGAGPIGLLTAAVARVAGAAEIYMTEPLDWRRSFASDYVADAVLNPDRSDVVAEILRLTDGRGVDVAFEAAGAPDTPAQAAEIVRPGGRVVVSGIPSDDVMTMKAGTVRRKGLTIKLVRRMKHTYPRAIHMVRTGRVDVKPLASQVYPLARIADAYDTAAERADGVLKAIIRVSE